MGDPRHSKKAYDSPKKPWDRKLLETERKMLDQYGLRNKREVRRVQTLLRKKRANARTLLALPLEQRVAKEKELLDSLVKMGIMRGTPQLNDVLSLTVEAFLERRLETLVVRKRMANTMRQARQFITHGHIQVGDHKVTVPSYFVTKDEENTIKYFGVPMILQSPEKAKKDDMQLKKEFAEMRGEPGGSESALTGETPEAPVNPDVKDAAEQMEGA